MLTWCYGARTAHLQGILFHDRMKREVVDSVRSSLVALEDSYAAAHPGVKIQRVPAPKAAKGF
jgi:peptide deformylase